MDSTHSLPPSLVGADIDTLCVVPTHVLREDFFIDMVELLKARHEVTELAVNPCLLSLFTHHVIL